MRGEKKCMLMRAVNTSGRAHFEVIALRFWIRGRHKHSPHSWLAAAIKPEAWFALYSTSLISLLQTTLCDMNLMRGGEEVCGRGHSQIFIAGDLWSTRPQRQPSLNLYPTVLEPRPKISAPLVTMCRLGRPTIAQYEPGSRRRRRNIIILLAALWSFRDCYVSHVESSFLFATDAIQTSPFLAEEEQIDRADLTPAMFTSSSWAAATTVGTVAMAIQSQRRTQEFHVVTHKQHRIHCLPGSLTRIWTIF